MRWCLTFVLCVAASGCVMGPVMIQKTPRWGRSFQASGAAGGLRTQYIRVDLPRSTDLTIYLGGAYDPNLPPPDRTSVNYELFWSNGGIAMQRTVLAPARGMAVHVVASVLEVNSTPSVDARIQAFAAMGRPTTFELAAFASLTQVPALGTLVLNVPDFATGVRVFAQDSAAVALATAQQLAGDGTGLSTGPLADYTGGYVPILPECEKFQITAGASLVNFMLYSLIQQ